MTGSVHTNLRWMKAQDVVIATQARDVCATMLLLLTWAPTSTQLIKAMKSLAALSAAINKHLLANAACGMSIHGWWPFLSRPLQCMPLILVCEAKQL